MNFKVSICATLSLLLILSALSLPAPVCAQDSLRINYGGADSTGRQIIINLFSGSGGKIIDTRAPGTDSWFADDKARHLLGSMISTTLLIQSGQRVMAWRKKDAKVFAAGTTLSLGIVKEIYDSRKTTNHFCWKDLAADAAGVLLGILITGMR